MDALKRSLAVFAVIVVMLCVVPASLDADSSTETDGLLLYQISPYGNDEGVSIRNYGNTTVNLLNYQIQTKNYELTITKSYDVKPDSFITFYNTDVENSNFTTQGESYRFLDSCSSNKTLTEKSNILVNGGDYVHLIDSKGKVIDSVYYGSKTETDPDHWVDKPLSISSQGSVKRVNGYDTDSSVDWVKYVIGGTNYDFDPNLKFDAKVTPFLFPESGGIPVLKALESATKYIYIEIYMLANENVYSLLRDKLDAGVEVKILVEGNSVNKGSELVPNLPYMQTLIDNGASIHLIGVGDDGVKDRFVYDHAKFAVIDDEKVIVTSENWTKSNLNGSISENPYKGDNGNRGWGVIIENSPQYVAYMKGVFENDFRTDSQDVKDLAKVYPRINAATLGSYKAPAEATFSSYSAKVTPILSCDNSAKAANYYISTATKRVYSEQQSFQEYYIDQNIISPFSAMASKAKDLDCRLILSSNCSKDLVLQINQTSLVKAAWMNGSTYVHNKGLICDDITWVSSINWTDNSFKNNRECCVAIQSQEVADFFAESFMQDFSKFYTYDGFSVDITEIQSSYPAGKEITLTVTPNPSTGNYQYTWDLGDGSEPMVTTVPRITCTPRSDGDATACVLTVTIKDLDTGKTATVTKSYTVIKESPADDIVETLDENKYTIIPILIAVFGALIALVKSSSNKKKKKNTNTKRRK